MIQVIKIDYQKYVTLDTYKCPRLRNKIARILARLLKQ
jgi:hypothetical protein